MLSPTLQPLKLNIRIFRSACTEQFALVEARGAPDLKLRARELHGDAAERSLNDIVLARIDEDTQDDDKTTNGKEKISLGNDF